MSRIIAIVFACLAVSLFVACSKQESSTASAKAPAHDDHAHDDGHDHSDHDHAADAQGDHTAHGKVIELGTATIGGWTVRAARDEGEIKPGGDAPLDVWLTGGTGKVLAVRFWIGSENAAGSIKARADIENPAEPNHWHTHAELPNPMPAGSKLWVEIEIEGKGKQTASFDLKG